MNRRIRKRAFLVVIVLLNIVVLEILSYLFGYYFLSDKGVIYVDDTPTKEAFRAYLDSRDPVLGWPEPSEYGQEDLDELGSRVNTFFPDSSLPACVSAYGDSFTFSMEVDSVFAYPNQLSRLLQCRVNNFGVIGYGTDQAFLRFRNNAPDNANIVILAHVSEDIIRNVNQFAGFLYGDRFGFKPRFVVSDDFTLQLIPMLSFNGLDYADVYQNPADYLHHDYFIPDGRSGIPFLRFPYSVAVAKSFFSYKFKGFLDAGTSYTAPFYDIGHPSNALQVTELIIRDFKYEAFKREAVPLVVIVPIVVDVLDRQSTGSWPYQALVDYLENEGGIAYLDFGEVLLKYMDETGKGVCEFYRKAWYAKGGCTGHFNEEGYLLLAQTVASKIRSMRTADLGSIKDN